MPEQLSDQATEVVVELQRVELNRLLQENERLNARMDRLVQMLEREQVLRQQMQETVDDLSHRLALPRAAAAVATPTPTPLPTPPPPTPPPPPVAPPHPPPPRPRPHRARRSARWPRRSRRLPAPLTPPKRPLQRRPGARPTARRSTSACASRRPCSTA